MSGLWLDGRKEETKNKGKERCEEDNFAMPMTGLMSLKKKGNKKTKESTIYEGKSEIEISM